VQQCITDPNPVWTYRQELDGIGYSGRELLQRMEKIKFLPEPTDAK
jgi:hypothetical protein